MTALSRGLSEASPPVPPLTTTIPEGVEERQTEGVPLRVYSAAKTVADCFKLRNQIGTNVALEGLRDAWRTKMATDDELWRHAKVCRVANVMRPYLEAVVR